MLIKLTEVCTNSAVTSVQTFTLREVFVNPEHVIMIREDAYTKKLNENNSTHESYEEIDGFSKLTINRGHSGTEIIVVGSPDLVEKKLNLSHSKQLLQG